MKESPIPNRTLHEGTFPARDSVLLYYRFWKSENTKNPLFLIVHGFGEHSRRYDDFLKKLEGLPLSFAAFDLRGHGRSGGERVFVSRFEDYLSDLDDFLEHLRKAHGLSDSRLFLFGHSLGGQIAAYYTAARPEQIRTLMLSSPCIAPQLWVPGAGKLALLLSNLLPHIVLNNPVQPVFLTHDREEIARYKQDKLIQRRITFRLAGEMVRAGAEIFKRAHEIRVPVYLFAAGNEIIVNKAAAKKFFNRIPSGEKRWIEFEGFYHEILKESGREKVYEAMTSVLQKCLSGISS